MVCRVGTKKKVSVETNGACRKRSQDKAWLNDTTLEQSDATDYCFTFLLKLAHQVLHPSLILPSIGKDTVVSTMSASQEPDLPSSQVLHTRTSSFTVVTETVSFTTAADGPGGGGVLATLSPRGNVSSEHGAGISEQGVMDDSLNCVDHEPWHPEPKAVQTDKTADEENKGASEDSESTDQESESADEELAHADGYCSNPDCCDPALAWHSKDVIQDMRSMGLDVDEGGYWYHPGSFYMHTPKGIVFEED